MKMDYLWRLRTPGTGFIRFWGVATRFPAGGKHFYLPVLTTVWMAVAFPVVAQKILNGSFENALIQCGYNLANDDFSAKMPNVIGFGEKNELDILQADCNYGPAQDGRFFVALFNYRGSTDALALKLSEPFMPELTYTLEFYAKIGEITDFASRLVVGVGNTVTALGEPVFASSDLYREWTKYTLQFTPPVAGSYITVSVESRDRAWLFVDHFSLICPSASLGNDTLYCDINNVLLETEGRFDRYLWNDQSVGTSLTINDPGLYWVEAVTGACTVRDSILITEDEFNCRCKVYFPNGFSPNDDGINDTWLPVSPCELMDYELSVFSRWGGLVFRSTDPAAGWSGKGFPAGVYPYFLRYRTAHGAAGEITEKGMVTLIR